MNKISLKKLSFSWLTISYISACWASTWWCPYHLLRNAHNFVGNHSWGNKEIRITRWCKDNRLSPIKSRRRNSWDITVTESFFSSLKSELIKKRIYPTRAQAKSEIFEYIEEFYNRVRRHKHLSQLSPMAFEQRQIALWKVSTILGECHTS